ncbi:MAG: hypothetical protein HQ522_16275 [Bacteroidetes bacterium]|nr:hypothetical protein [Bacteroidota bacterium]
MKPHKITLLGKIDSTGQVRTDNAQMLNFSKMWENKRITVTIEIEQPGSSGALKGLYYGKLVPEFRQALWDNGERMTEAKTEAYLRSLCPVLWNESVRPGTGEYEASLREINDLDNSEFVAYFEHLEEIYAELFGASFVDLKQRIRELENELKEQ